MLIICVAKDENTLGIILYICVYLLVVLYDMPLIQPRKVTEIQDWYLIKQDSHLILEKKTPVKKAFGQTVTNYRILLKFNRQQVAQATSEKDILECWTQLQPSPEVNSFVQVQALDYAPGHLFALIDQLYKKELEEIGITLKPTHVSNKKSK